MTDTAQHEDEYDDAMVALLEIIWGEAFLAPGGADTVRRIVGDLDLRDRLVLDIGSGLGGGDLVLARDMGARVIGIDLEAPLVARAEHYAKAAGLSDRIAFHCVEPGPLQFADETFDLVYSSGAFTQISDKAQMFDEVHRVLKPGGHFAVYDWMKGPGPISDNMRYFYEMEGLTYAMETADAHRALLEGAGFTDITIEDDGGWYRTRAHEEYDEMKGPLAETMLKSLGDEKTAHFLDDWRSMLVVLDKGELRPSYFRGRKP